MVAWKRSVKQNEFPRRKLFEAGFSTLKFIYWKLIGPYPINDPEVISTECFAHLSIEVFFSVFQLL